VKASYLSTGEWSEWRHRASAGNLWCGFGCQLNRPLNACVWHDNLGNKNLSPRPSLTMHWRSSGEKWATGGGSQSWTLVVCTSWSTTTAAWDKETCSVPWHRFSLSGMVPCKMLHRCPVYQCYSFTSLWWDTRKRVSNADRGTSLIQSSWPRRDYVQTRSRKTAYPRHSPGTICSWKSREWGWFTFDLPPLYCPGIPEGGGWGHWHSHLALSQANDTMCVLQDPGDGSSPSLWHKYFV